MEFQQKNEELTQQHAHQLAELDGQQKRRAAASCIQAAVRRMLHTRRMRQLAADLRRMVGSVRKEEAETHAEEKRKMEKAKADLEAKLGETEEARAAQVGCPAWQRTSIFVSKFLRWVCVSEFLPKFLRHAG